LRVEMEEDMGVGAEFLDDLRHDRERLRSRRREGHRVEGLRPHADDDRPRPALRPASRVERHAQAAEDDVVTVDRALDEVHRRSSDECGDKEVRGVLVQPLGRVHLQDPARVEHRHALAERHRLDLVMRHVDRRHAEPRVELRQRRAHLDAELRVEVREWLVHQERLRLAHDRAPHRHALALSAGELRRLALEQLLQAEQFRHLLHAAPRLVFRHAPNFQPVADVLAHAHMRIERVALEDHRDVAAARGELGDVGAADRDGALRHLL
jgi:hypothetical protein